jgi:biopolymer transport protein ExbD
MDLPRDDDAGLNLTPMIDLVFNLVVFFLISTDLSHKDFREMDLPRAHHGAVDGPDPADRRIVASLDADGTLHLRGRSVSLAGEAGAGDDLVAALRSAVAAARAAGAPTPPILVRGDRAAPWRHVQTLMQACASPGVGIDRIQFAVSAPPADRPGGS